MIDKKQTRCEFAAQQECKELAQYQIRFWIMAEGRWSNWIALCFGHFQDYQAEEMSKP